jgi:hypothetical protein
MTVHGWNGMAHTAWTRLVVRLSWVGCRGKKKSKSKARTAESLRQRCACACFCMPTLTEGMAKELMKWHAAAHHGMCCNAKPLSGLKQADLLALTGIFL